MTAQQSGPLQRAEERVWRDLTRFIIMAPRLLDEDLQRGANISLSEYTVLVHLSEAASGHLRLSELADLAYLSGSRMTRLVGALAAQNLVVKTRTENDARGIDVQITEDGLTRLRDAYPVHLASVRARIMNRIDRPSLACLGKVMTSILTGLQRFP